MQFSIALALPNVIHRFCDQEQEEIELYQFCIDVLKSGLTSYRSKSAPADA